MFLSGRLMPAVALLFFIFIVWIIVVSDNGHSNILINSIRAVPYGDKLGHMSLYCILAILVSASIKSHSKNYFGLPLGCALVLIFALGEELPQGLFPATRALDAGDAFADFVGVYLAAWMIRAIKKRKNFIMQNDGRIFN